MKFYPLPHKAKRKRLFNGVRYLNVFKMDIFDGNEIQSMLNLLSIAY